LGESVHLVDVGDLRALPAGAEDPGPRAIHAPGQRYDRDPEEGSRGIRESDAAAPVYFNPSTGYPTTRYTGGPGESTRGSVSSGSPLESR
jgi:hypothetical protein